MVSFITKLKSITSSRPEQNAKTPPSLPGKTSAKKRPQEHNPNSRGARSTQSISPKLRTFFGPQSPKVKLGVLESPKSPESAYSGVALLGDVEIVRRVSKGKVKKIELSHVHTYETASAGTQTEERAIADNVKDMLKRRSGLAKSGWEWLHSEDAGLLFMSSTAEQKMSSREADLLNGTETSLPLTGNLLLKLQQAIAVDAELQACQKRTARETATLNAYHEGLRKRKETLKDQLEALKTMPNYDLNEEKLAVDKELVRVWEASIDTMDERLKSEERLEKKRDDFEQVARLALSVLVLGLAERMLVDVVDGRERANSEVEFEMRYRL